MDNHPIIRPSLCRLTVAIISILIVVAGIYAQTVGFDFIDLDDGVYVSLNPRVLSGLSWDNIQWALETLHGGFWIPVTWVSFMMDQTLFGAGAWGFHLTNTLLHGLNSILVLLVLFSLTRSFWPSLIAALIFAAHPLHVESVAWVSERKDVLYAFFFLAAIWAHGQYAKTLGNIWTVSVLILGSVAMAAKPMAITLPVILLLMDYWPLNRFSLKTWSLIKEKIPLFFTGGVFGVVTVYAQYTYQGVQSLEQVPLVARLENSLLSYGAYIGKTVWPVKLGVFYPHVGSGRSVLELSCLCLVFFLFSYGAFKIRRKAPWVFVGWFWFILSLLPVIGLIQSGNQGMADRFMYMPLLGLLIALVWSGCWIQEKRPRLAVPLLTVAMIVTGSAAALSCVQARHWHNSISLYRHTLEVTKKNFVIHEFLGASLAGRGHYEEAKQEYAKALIINPDYGDAHYGLGVITLNQGQFSVAASHFRGALAAAPGHTEALYGLGTAQLHLGLKQEARENLEKALANNPLHQGARNSLFIILQEAQQDLLTP